ncbi:MAG: trimethylamine methyltransferase family protein [Candidatus Promineifilaceae bacterium]
MSTPALQPIKPDYHLRILSDEQLDQFKTATLEILEDIGFHCPSRKALEIYAQHGAVVDFETQIVKLPPSVVIEYMSCAPRYYTLGARLPEFDLILDGTTMYCATDGCGTETIDFFTGKRRTSVKQDVAMTAQITDYLSSFGFYWPMVSAQDYATLAPLHELDASFNNTVKHVQTPTVVREIEGRYSVEMARIIAGDDETMRRRPPLSILICTIAPLAQDHDAMEAALVTAEAGLPVGFMSMATAGSTAPATITGTIALADAEMVSAMVLIQMAYPGAPVYHSMMPGIMHPMTGAFMGSSWEADLFFPVGVELAHMWGVPTLAGIGPGGADSSGWDSAAGIASNMLLCALCGAETASGLGLREGCTLLSLADLVLDSELVHQVRVSAAGLDTSQDAFALDIIKDVGPRGHYLTQKHTREQMRKLQFSNVTYQPKKGSSSFRDPIKVARERTEWILENHEPEPLSADQRTELERVLKAAEREIV